jgi:hypothetical protein
MITKELLDYINGQRIKKVSDESIKTVLIDNGWMPSDVEEAYSSIRSNSNQAPTIATKPHKETKIGPSNWIAIIFAIFLALAWLPLGPTVSSLMAPVIVITGAVAAITFIASTIKSAKGKKPLIQVFMILGGIVIGLAIFIISLFSGLISGLRYAHLDC